MSGFKHRYIVVKVRAEQEQSMESTLKTYILKEIKDMFGDYVLAMVDYLEILEYHKTLQLAIIRCNLSIYKYVCYAVIMNKKMSDAKLSCSILHVSGIMKKAKSKLIKELSQSSKNTS
ncbi:ribonuclease P/MRP protein subunit POP5 [Enteropsectra breve]|nr:ribonuclease P/MRP protein subunit POP5 [Enteropsectra breve]